MNIAKAALFFLLALVPVRALVTPEFQLDEPLEAVSNLAQTSPSVAFNGSIYVAVWQTQTNTNSMSIRLRRFSAAGQPLGPAESLPIANLSYPEIASNGKDFMLIARHQQPEEAYVAIYAIRLDQQGKLNGQPIGTAMIGDFPKIASDGTNYLIFASWPQLVCARVMADGSGFGPVTSLNGIAGVGASIAFGGGTYLAVWSAGNGEPGRIYAHRISPEAAQLTVDPIHASMTSFNAINPSVAFANGTFLVAWYDYAGVLGQVRARRVTVTGEVMDLGVGIMIAPQPVGGPVVVGPHGDGFIAAWHYTDYQSTRFEIRTTTISAAGQPSPGHVISTRASPSVQTMAINAQGPNSMLLWANYSPETHYDIVFNHIAADAAPGPAQILENGPNFQSSPAAAFGANGYLVVWQDNRNALTNADDIFGMFIDEHGRRKSPAFPIAASGADESTPAVAAAGDHYLVVWRESTSPYVGDDNIKGALLINQQIAAQLAICTETNNQRGATVASNGKDFLVAWRDERDQGDDDIWGAHITRDGVVSGPNNGFPICTFSEDQQAVSIASNGTNYLVVWRDRRNSEPDFNFSRDDIYGAIVEAGQTTAPINFPISIGQEQRRAPDVDSNGRDYFVAWRDDRGDNGNPFAEIYGTPVSANGEVANPTGFPLTPIAEEQREPALARHGDNYLLTWLQQSVVGGPLNVFAREIPNNGQPASAAVKLSGTDYDEETLDLAANPTGTALMLSQTAAGLYGPVGRARGAIVCLSDCPVLLNAVVSQNKPLIKWNAEPGENYSIEYKDDLNAPTWQLLTESAASEYQFLEASDLNATGTRFYRVVRIP
jgi:hypothetical protein